MNIKKGLQATFPYIDDFGIEVIIVCTTCFIGLILLYLTETYKEWVPILIIYCSYLLILSINFLLKSHVKKVEEYKKNIND